MTGFFGATKFRDLPTLVVDMIDKAFPAILTLSITFAVARFVSGFIKYYGSSMGAALQVTSIGQVFGRFIVVAIGTIIILGGLGVEITPLVASLGIGALAIALAL